VIAGHLTGLKISRKSAAGPTPHLVRRPRTCALVGTFVIRRDLLAARPSLLTIRNQVPSRPGKAVLACSADGARAAHPTSLPRHPIRRANAPPKPRVLARASSCKARVPASPASTA
jgi:hypothetical protein